MYQILALALLSFVVTSSYIRRYPIRPVAAEFDNATVLKDNKNYRLQTRNKNISVLNVPDVYQATDYTCGPSSLTAVLSYYGKQDLRQMYLAKLALTDENAGTQPQKLHRAILQLGFKAEIQENMTISLLEQYLAARRPVIVLIQAWKDDDDTTPYPINFENGHYVAVIGFDSQNIYFEDPWIHGSITYMRKIDLIDRWHGNTDEPADRRIYAFAGEQQPDLSGMNATNKVQKIQQEGLSPTVIAFVQFDMHWDENNQQESLITLVEGL